MTLKLEGARDDERDRLQEKLEGIAEQLRKTYGVVTTRVVVDEEKAVLLDIQGNPLATMTLERADDGRLVRGHFAVSQYIQSRFCFFHVDLGSTKAT